MFYTLHEKDILVEISKLVYHPYKIYTSGEKADSIEELAKDISINEQVNPIYISERNEVIDGRRICEALKLLGETMVRARRVKINESDIPFFMVSANLYRQKSNWEKINEATIILEKIKRHQGKKIVVEAITTPTATLAQVTQTLNDPPKVLAGPNCQPYKPITPPLNDPPKIIAVPNCPLPKPEKPITPREQAIEQSGADISPRTFDKVLFIKQVDEKFPNAGLMKGIERGDLSIDKAEQRAKEIKERSKQKNEAEVKPIFHIPVHGKAHHIFNKSNHNMSEVQDESIDCGCTSHYYWNQRQYDNSNEPGKEKTVEQYLDNLMPTYTEAYKKFKHTGNLFVNMADTYQLHDGSKERNLSHNLIPERFVLRMADIGWHKVKTIIWYKSTANLVGNWQRRPETQYEPVYWFVKSPDYYYNPISIPHNREIKLSVKGGGRMNPDGTVTEQKMLVTRAFDTFKDVIEESEFLDIITTNSAAAESTLLKKYYDAHPAIFPMALPLLPILQCCPPNGKFLEPFLGSGMGMIAAMFLGQECWGYEMVPKLFKIAEKVLHDLDTDLQLYHKQMKTIVEQVRPNLNKAA
jgi:DNA modification methylase